MRTRFNKNGTVSIQQMPEDMYYAILAILRGARYSFDWDEEAGVWRGNDNFICSLSAEEKEFLDKADWDI